MGVSVYLKKFNVSGLMRLYEDGKEEEQVFFMQVYARSKSDAKHIAVGRKVMEYRDKGRSGLCMVTNIEVE